MRARDFQTERKTAGQGEAASVELGNLRQENKGRGGGSFRKGVVSKRSEGGGMCLRKEATQGTEGLRLVNV